MMFSNGWPHAPTKDVLWWSVGVLSAFYVGFWVQDNLRKSFQRPIRTAFYLLLTSVAGVSLWRGLRMLWIVFGPAAAWLGRLWEQPPTWELVEYKASLRGAFPSWLTMLGLHCGAILWLTVVNEVRTRRIVKAAPSIGHALRLQNQA